MIRHIRALQRRWQCCRPIQRVAVLGSPAFLAGAAALALTASGMHTIGLPRLALQIGLLSTPAAYCALAVTRTVDAPIWAAMTAIVGAVLLGILTAFTAAYLGVAIAFVGYLTLILPERTATALNELMIARALATSAERCWALLP